MPQKTLREKYDLSHFFRTSHFTLYGKKSLYISQNKSKVPLPYRKWTLTMTFDQPLLFALMDQFCVSTQYESREVVYYENTRAAWGKIPPIFSLFH